MKSTQMIKDNLLTGSQLIGNVDLIYKIFSLQHLGECFIDYLEAVAYPSSHKMNHPRIFGRSKITNKTGFIIMVNEH